MTDPRTPDGLPLEDYATALPRTAQPTAGEPAEDAGHLLPEDEWAKVVADAERDR